MCTLVSATAIYNIHARSLPHLQKRELVRVALRTLQIMTPYPLRTCKHCLQHLSTVLYILGKHLPLQEETIIKGVPIKLLESHVLVIGMCWVSVVAHVIMILHTYVHHCFMNC